MSRPPESTPLRHAAAQPFGPAAAITRRAADRLRAGHVWVYRSDIESLIPAPGQTELASGSLLTVVDSRGIPLGSAIYSSVSQLTLRVISTEAGLSREAYLALVRERLHQALTLRDELAPASDDNNACRLVFSEADALPGIIADKYNDLIVLQLLTQGTAQDDVRAIVREVFNQRLSPAAIVERPDPRIRELEQLPAVAEEVLFFTGEKPRFTTTFTINSVHFSFDSAAGQKTGAFLDQRLNYAAAARYARGRALDVCTYQGGFALHLAQHCQQVTGVDASRTALETADKNLELNPQITSQVEWIEADAFELLREFDGSNQRFDTIVLDPPAFAKTKRAADSAMRGYKELNLRGMRMLRDGILVTCSCSHHVDLKEFMEVVTAAAVDAGKRVQVLETRGAAPDHPAVLTIPETSYLKCLILKVS